MLVRAIISCEDSSESRRAREGYEMRPGKCDRCGRLVEHLVGIMDHPDLLDGDFCERCLEECPRCHNCKRLEGEVDRLQSVLVANYICPDCGHDTGGMFGYAHKCITGQGEG